jgi:hypothetical protein
MNIFDGLAGYPRRGRQRYSAGAGAAASAGESAVPIKSKAQRRKFAELLVKGKISPETFEKWNRGAGKQELPERLPKAKAKAKRKARSKRPAKRKSPA